MSRTKVNYHMSEKAEVLPPLQKAIIIHLAENGPQTINETVNKIKHHYKPTWIAFNSLKKKGLIYEIGIKAYRGRNYPQFWITPIGQLTALVNGANINKVKENALKYCGKEEREDLAIFYEIAESVGPETANKIFRFILKNGKFELSYFPMDERDIEKIFTILRKYPKYWKKVEDMGNKIIKKIKEVLGP